MFHARPSHVCHQIKSSFWFRPFLVSVVAVVLLLKLLAFSIDPVMIYYAACPLCLLFCVNLRDCASRVLQEAFVLKPGPRGQDSLVSPVCQTEWGTSLAAEALPAKVSSPSRSSRLLGQGEGRYLVNQKARHRDKRRRMASEGSSGSVHRNDEVPLWKTKPQPPRRPPPPPPPQPSLVAAAAAAVGANASIGSDNCLGLKKSNSHLTFR